MRQRALGELTGATPAQSRGGSQDLVRHSFRARLLNVKNGRVNRISKEKQIETGHDGHLLQRNFRTCLEIAQEIERADTTANQNRAPNRKEINRSAPTVG